LSAHINEALSENEYARLKPKMEKKLQKVRDRKASKKQ
jgi:hypothetical protein